MNHSTAVTGSIELIPLGPSDLSPLLTSVKIKVFHLGENRNRSSIDKNTALQMVKTLRGLPIVGKYRQDKGDFTDHGQVVTIDDRGINITTETRPYGFVDLNAPVWFEDYIDINEKGEQVQHTYVVTTGVTWTGQYPELKEAFVAESGRPQSMELDDESLKGYWAKNNKTGIDFFIINSSIITKLCILGEDTEPCFIGSSVTPNDNTNFTKVDDSDDDFSATLFTMMKQLRELKNNKGGYSMDGVMDNSLESTVVENQDSIEDVKTTFDDGGDAGSTGEGSTDAGETTEPTVEGGSEESNDSDVEETAPAEGSEGNNTPSTEQTELPPASGENQEDASAELEEEIEQACINVPKKTEFVKKDEEEEDEKEESEDNTESEGKESESKSDDNEDDKEDEKKKYSLLEEQYNELQNKYSLLENEVVELRKFKNQIDDEKKDALIESFYMLSDEDKKEVVENKSKYSLDDIEAKLSIICVRKKVNFNLVEEDNSEKEEVSTTYNLNSTEAEMLPAWLKRVKETRSCNND